MDRRDEVDEVVRNVESGINTLVLAERGGGRTSLLLRAAGNLEERGRVLPVLTSGEVAADGADLLAAVTRRLARSAGQAEVAALEVTAPLGAPHLIDLVDELGRIVAALPSSAAIFLDGANPSAAHTVFGQLRNELWQLDGLTWVLGGEISQRSAYLEPPADAFWESEVVLDRFDRSNLERILARRSVDVPATAMDSVLDAADGNPRKLMIAAHEATRGAGPDGIRSRANMSDATRRELGDAAARLVAYLEANGLASASEQRLLDELGWSRGRAAQIFKRLEDAGMVTSEVESSAGSRGRPRKLFKLVER